MSFKKTAAKGFAAGFTLVEVLITLAILSTLTLLTAQSIQQAIKAKLKIQDQMDDVTRMRDALKLMERDINLAYHYNDIETEMNKLIEKYKKPTSTTTSAAPGSPGTPVAPPAPSFFGSTVDPDKAERQDPTTHFMGENEKLNFVTLNNSRAVKNSRQAEFSEVGYEWKDCKSLSAEGGSSKCLWRRSSPFVDLDVETGGQEVVLLENLSELKFRYLGKGKQDWVNEWRSGKGADGTTKDRFPDAVEISMTLIKEVKGKKKEYSMQTVVPLHFPNNLEKSTASDSTSTNRGGSNGVFQ